MRRLLLITLITMCCAYAIEHSMRIKSLGTDFAYLIPDYETDLYNNPYNIGTSLVGISYDPHASMPLKGIVLSKRFGWYGKYWGSSTYHLHDTQYGWESSKSYRIDFEDLWMLDMRGHIWKIFEDVWHLYNDGYYTRQEYQNSNNLGSCQEIFALFLKAQGEALSVSEKLKVHMMAGGAYYYQGEQERDWYTVDQLFFIPSARIGLFYRNSPTPNEFTSWYIDIGGPRSTKEIDNLPYSIFMRAWDDISAIQSVLGANALIAKLAWVKGFPLQNKGFFAIGLRDSVLYQKMEHAQADTTMCYLQNRFSIPCAVEYTINTVSLRIGTVFYYQYTNRKKEDGDTIFIHEITHTPHYSYSFGLGWEPVDRFHIDVHYRHRYYFDLRDWKLYLRYML